MISHKILRYAVPIFLPLVFAANAFLIGFSDIYNILFLGQTTFYLTAFVGWVCDRLGLKVGPLSLPYYFVLANAASAVAFVKFIRGQNYVVWEPIRESSASNDGR